MFKINNPDKVARLWKIWIPRQTEPIYHCVFQNIVDMDEKNKAKNTMGKVRIFYFLIVLPFIKNKKTEPNATPQIIL